MSLLFLLSMKLSLTHMSLLLEDSIEYPQAQSSSNKHSIPLGSVEQSADVFK